jgi:hypothetical protein
MDYGIIQSETDRVESAPAADFEYHDVEPGIVGVSLDGRTLGELHAMPSGRYQIVNPWGPKTFSNRADAAAHLWGMK